MFWSSKSLLWLIPSLFLKAPKGGTIAIISPWIENVKLLVFNWEGSSNLKGIVYLTEVMSWLHNERGIHFIFYVREDQLFPSMNYRLASVRQSVAKFTDFRGVPDLHAKVIATDSTILETSANILHYSIYRNVETISIYPNKEHDAKIFTKNFFARHGLLIH